MRSSPRLLALAAALAAAATTARPAAAGNETSETVSHPFERVWPAAVRFIRVDAGHAIDEKDAETGYILFAYEHEGSEFRGALEVIRIRDDKGRDAVRLVLRIDRRPSYLERAMMNGLMRKLRDELGRPPPPPPAEDEGGEDEDGGDADSRPGPA